MLQQSTSDGIYNNTVDELTRILTKDGYRVLISVAYPGDADDKHIVWVNSTAEKAFKYCWPKGKDEPELWTAGYTEGCEADALQWQFVDSVFCGYEDLSSEEQNNITGAFTEAYHVVSARKITLPDKPGAKPKLETVLGKAVTSTMGIITLLGLLKVLISLIGCE